MNSQTKTTQMTPHSPDIQHMQDLLEHQRLAYQRHQVPSAKERIDRLSRLRRVLQTQSIMIITTVQLVKLKLASC